MSADRAAGPEGPRFRLGEEAEALAVAADCWLSGAALTGLDERDTFGWFLTGGTLTRFGLLSYTDHRRVA